MKVHIHSSFLSLYFRELSSLSFQHSGPDSSAFFYTEVALHFSSEKLQNPSLWFGCVYSSRSLVWAKPSLAAAHCLSLFFFFFCYFFLSTRPLLLFARRLAASPMGQRMCYAKRGVMTLKHITASWTGTWKVSWTVNKSISILHLLAEQRRNSTVTK